MKRYMTHNELTAILSVFEKWMVIDSDDRAEICNRVQAAVDKASGDDAYIARPDVSLLLRKSAQTWLTKLDLIADPSERVAFVADTMTTKTTDLLVQGIGDWQRVTFPHATPHSTTKHLLKEAMELHSAPDDAEEMADVLFMLIAAASASGVDLWAATRAKFEKNKARTWGAPDADGVVEHAAEG